MRKKKKPNHSRKSRSQQNVPVRRNKNRRGLLRLAVALLIALPAVGGAIAAFKHNYEVTHDLSVIGQGVPTVVQIHDPACQLCQQLRRNASAAVDSMDGELLYRVADITTPEGSRLQRKYKVPHVTLLLFDGNGELSRVLEGVKSEELLKHTFSRHIEGQG